MDTISQPSSFALRSVFFYTLQEYVQHWVLKHVLKLETHLILSTQFAFSGSFFFLSGQGVEIC